MFQIVGSFLTFTFSQGSVATCFRRGEIFNDFYYTFTAESDSERILKIGQHLPKLWAIKYRVLFYEHGVDVRYMISYYWAFTRSDRRTDRSVRPRLRPTVCQTSRTDRLDRL